MSGEILDASSLFGMKTHDGQPARRNADNTYSTELSITVTNPRLNGGKPTNIPSLWGGKELDERGAVEQAVRSGKKYQAFGTVDEAVSAAKARSNAGGAGADTGDIIDASTLFGGGKPATQKSFGDEFIESVKQFDVKEGLLGRFAVGLGQRIRDWTNEGKSLEQLQREGATFKQAPVRAKAPPIGEAVSQLVEAAKTNPGATLGEFVRAAGEDAWMFLIPEFGAEAKLAQVVTRIAGKAAGRVAGATGAGVKLGAAGAGMELAAQSVEPGKFDQNAAENAAAMWGVTGGAAKLLFPGQGRGAVPERPRAPAGPEAPYAGRPRPPEPPQDIGPAPEAAAAESSAYLAWLEKMQSTRDLGNLDKMRNAEQRAYDLMQRGASKAEVDRAVAKDPLLGEALAAVRARRGQTADASSGAFVGGVEADIVGPPGPSPKWRAGKAYMDMPEVVEAAGPQKRLPFGPLAAGAGVGAVVANEMLGQPADRDATLATGGLLTLAALGKMSPATPLGSLLERNAYTLKTLDRLPQNRFEFTREQVMQQLNRPDVGKAEKDILLQVLGDRKKISAVELMEGFKRETGDFELKPQVTDEYADYGLDAIGRTDSYGAPADAIEPQAARTTVYQSPVELGAGNHFDDPNYFAHTRSFDEGGVRHVVEVQSDLAQKAGKVLTVEERGKLETHYQRLTDERKSWLDAVEALKESGSRTLDELQAQGKDASAPEWAEFLRRRNESAARYRAAQQDVEARMAEIRAKLEAKDADLVELVRPMLKDWHKRIIREELDAAAKARDSATDPEYKNVLETRLADYTRLEQNGGYGQIGETLETLRRQMLLDRAALSEIKRLENAPAAVRFATADTVAKVEGWPTQYGEAGRRIRQRIETLEHDLRLATAPNSRLRAPTRLGESSEQAVARWEAELAEQKALLKEVEANEAANAGSAPRFRPEHQGIYDRYRKDIEKFLTKDLGGKPYTDTSGHTWIEVPLPKRPTTGRPGGPKQMMGFADPKLLAGIAAIGGGLALASSWEDLNKTAQTAGIAAIVGLSAIAVGRPGPLADWAKVAGRIAENNIGNVSAEMRSMSQKLLRRQTTFEWDSLVQQHNATQAFAPFVHSLQRLSAADQKTVSLALMSGNMTKALEALKKLDDPVLAKEFPKVRAELERLGQELVSAGLLKGLRRDYFPQMVTDVDGLLNALGREDGDFLEQILAKANREAIKATGAALSALDVSILINKHLAAAVNRTTSGGKAGYLKKRSVEGVPEELLQFYAKPSEALTFYGRSASRQIERARYFGKHLAKDAATGHVNIDESIGNVVREVGGTLTREQRARLEEMLRQRFGPGERSPDRVTQAYRNVVTGLMLGNVMSSLRQFGDVGAAAALHGMMPTVRGIRDTVLVLKQGRLEQTSRYTLGDMGLINHIADDFVTSVKNPTVVGGVELSTANFADKALKIGGFSFTDEFSKLININAAINSARGKARTTSGKAELAARYGEYFGDDFPQLLKDLAAGKKTRLTGELVMRELSDAQPITKLEMPSNYVGNPSLRWLWTFKTWMIKQMNLVRERGLREIAKGDAASIRRGTGFILRYGLLMGTAGATMEQIISWIRGRDDEFTWGDIPENILKTFAMGKYVRDKIANDEPVEALAGAAVPPWQIFDQLVQRDPRVLNNIPGVGTFIYDHLYGDEWNAKQAKREEKEKRASTPSAIREKERRAREKERAR